MEGQRLSEKEDGKRSRGLFDRWKVTLLVALECVCVCGDKYAVTECCPDHCITLMERLKAT